MKILALLVGLCSLASFGAGLALARRTLAFASGSDYALVHDAAGNGNGYGIFLPSLLLLALGAFLARFAWNLWEA